MVFLKDLSFTFTDLGPHADQIKTIDNSSLFKQYFCYALEERVEEKSKERVFYSMKKNFYVYDLKKKEVVWEIGQAETVFFRG